MLKTSRSTESTTRPGKGKVGVGGDSGGDGSDDGSHDDEHSPRGSGRAHQRIHQLVRPGLWSSMMSLMEVGVVLLVSRSKSRRIVKKSERPPRPEKLQRSSVWKNVYRSTNPPSIGNEELELPLKL